MVGALLLFADYTITASLSAVEAFHYFGLGEHHAAQVDNTPPGDDIQRVQDDEGGTPEALNRWNSPALWAIVSILVIGAFNLMGPKHSAGFAIFAALGMMAITLLVVMFALPQIHWREVQWGRFWHPPAEQWYGFVYIVLALSGVEAIANLTGVMKKPVFETARKSIWLIAAEVAVFNVLLAIAMIALAPSRKAHTEDMLAFMAGEYIPAIAGFAWGEWSVRILGGLLLLSATNTAVNGLMSIIYVMSRDEEMPRIFQKLNSFGAPWVAAIVASVTPAAILLVYHDLKTLASLYAIGVVGAVAINCTITAFHPRLRGLWRKIAMASLGVLLIAIWVTLAFTKIHALIFVSIVLAAGLILRQLTRLASRRYPRPSLLRQAIMDQLSPEAMGKPKLLLATAGSDTLAVPALELAKSKESALVVCFVRQVALSYKMEAERKLTLDTDPAALALFTSFLEHGHRAGVPIIPVYDTGPNAAELIAEQAALNGASRVLLGSSRRGAIHKFIKGSFQQQIESLLPDDLPVQIIEPRVAT